MSQAHKELDTLEAYDLVADKLIARFGQPWMYDDKYKSILIANLVKSDTDFDSTKGASIKTYRYGGWKYAKMKMFQLKKREHNLASLDSVTSEGPLYSRLASKELEAIDTIMAEETERGQTNLINSILNSEKLTKVEKNYLRMIYQQGLSHSVIAEKLGVTKQAVSFTEQKALRKLRDIYVGNE